MIQLPMGSLVINRDYLIQNRPNGIDMWLHTHEQWDVITNPYRDFKGDLKFIYVNQWDPGIR